MNCWVARALQGSFSGSEANSVVAPEMKKPIRQAEQTFLLLEAHDAAEVADGNRQPTFAFMNCLNVRPFQIRKGKVRLPAFTEMLGELGCPFERLNETDVRNLPLEITCIRIDGRPLTDFDLVLGYWLGWCAAQLPPAMQDYLRPEHCKYAQLWEETGHHDIPRASKRTLKTVDRELREEKRALREEASEHPEPPKSEPAKRATLKALLSQAEPTSEAEAKAAEADDDYEVKACALPPEPESGTEEAQPSAKPVPEPEPKAKPRASQAKPPQPAPQAKPPQPAPQAKPSPQPQPAQPQPQTPAQAQQQHSKPPQQRLRRIRTASAGQGKKDATESENHPGEYLVQLNTDGSGEIVLSQRLQKVNGDDEAGIQMIRVREPTCQQLGKIRS
ncbi:hypothetical protein PAPYR_12803 [Paratrimastix pyriformis]|uniref:Uncharacterized protein n=1 Tax=Paratrimastix pyriformis TaxID=342808 RepID=A0ABQ8U7X4_9EUKA|nr:hypothetical protein PAPYR_12803 [Paratrimastix pyriformis]